ncbi:MAG: hypothetical protein DI630_12645 [Gordonia sp. (in: high G+C Gram-positive bacteria)]|nr:MAG: hypothetical protein DI630_12645 [Gordonia sp. (in: high G+C Gram-positive bacteria)]
MVRISGDVAADRSAAGARARAALASEARARAALESAQARSGAALALARMAGVPWRELEGDLGMSRQSLVERLARWGRRSGDQGTRFALPSVAVDGGAGGGGEVDDGQGEPPGLWSDPEVRAQTESAVRWVTHRARVTADKKLGDEELVAQCQELAARAELAALAETRRLAQVPGTTSRAAAQSVFRAAVAAAAVDGDRVEGASS